ncbi:hypothetical protein [Agrobacterium sp. NPDC089420]|uniref:hypothetical protein n=1 Tax=Agrobacterium sp. NPDC089420 TaxID=3363918 RepID=UPI0038508FA2
MSLVEANQQVLRERIRQADYVGQRDWANCRPLVSPREYFALGVTNNAIGNSRILQFGVLNFVTLLTEIGQRDDVSNLVVEMDDDFSEGWPTRDYIFVATSRDAETVSKWFAGIPPDTMLECQGGFVRARAIRIADIAAAPNHRIWALNWNLNLDDQCVE